MRKHSNVQLIIIQRFFFLYPVFPAELMLPVNHAIYAPSIDFYIPLPPATASKV